MRHLEMIGNDIFIENEQQKIVRKTTFYATLISLDEHLYKYLTTSILQRELHGDPFSEPINYYSNIENGYGVFGAERYSTVIMDVSKVQL